MPQQISDFNRLRALENILREVEYIEKYLLPPIVNETQKGITHIQNNSQDFFFPALSYLFEKTEKLKSSIEYIENMAEFKYLDE